MSDIVERLRNERDTTWVTALQKMLEAAAEIQSLRQKVDEMEGIIEGLALHAGEAPRGAFDKNPPSWAEDHLNEGSVERCGRCGSWCEVVRPGKTQCPTCGDDDLGALAIKARDILTALRERKG